MTMFRCYWCDELCDSDRDNAVLIGGEPICGYCAATICCTQCGVTFAEQDDYEPDDIVLIGNGYRQHYHADCWTEVRKVITADAKRDEMRDEG